MNEKAALVDSGNAHVAAVAASAAVALALMLRMTNSGWMVLVLAIPYLAICAGHLVVHRRIGRRGDRRPLFHAAVALSHVALVSAFLLQWDFGDGGGANLTLAVLYRPEHSLGAPTWLTETSNIALVAPVLTWPLLMVMAGRRPTMFVLSAALVAVVALVPAGTVAAAAYTIGRESADWRQALIDTAGGAVPTDCGSGDPRLMRPERPVPRDGVGSHPVWLVPDSPLDAQVMPDSVVIYRLGRDMRYSDGSSSFTFAVAGDHNGPVEVRVLERATGKPVAGSRYEGGALGGSVVLQGQGGSGTRYPWTLYRAHFRIPRSGCYEIEAAWRGGSWRLPLAAGERPER